MGLTERVARACAAHPWRTIGAWVGVLVASVLALGVVFTAVSGYLYIWFLRHVTAQTIGILAYIEPVSAALMAWAFVDEALTWQVVVGGALVIVAGATVVFLEPAGAAAPETAGIGSPR